MAGESYGICRAEVLNTVDPLGKGRLQILAPATGRMVSGWATPCTASGALSARVGDKVFVMFEGGDVQQPVVMGLAS